MGPKIDEVWVLKLMIFVIFFDRFFVDFMFNFASWPGRPDKRRAHTEHTQSTHRAHAEPWRGNRTGKSRSSSTFMKQSFNFLRASRSIAKTGFSLCLFWSPHLGKLLQICCKKRGCSGALSDPCCLSSPIGLSGFIWPLHGTLL